MLCVHSDDFDENAGNAIKQLHAAMLGTPIKTTWLNTVIKYAQGCVQDRSGG